MADLKVAGMEELLSTIKELGSKGARIENKAIVKAAQPILEEAIDNAPVSANEDGVHARDFLRTSRLYRKDDFKYVIVGLNKGDISEAFYLKFHEWGTSKGIVARPFLGPSYEKNKKKAIEIIKDELRKGLGLK